MRRARVPQFLARRLPPAACLLALGACSQVGNPLEMLQGPPAPDEFMVISRAPLQVPETVRRGEAAPLPRPEPGAPSPLNPDPLNDAQRALLGGPARGEATAASPSGGEAALRAAAARDRDPDLDVRRALEADEAARAEAEANEPYRPPTITELLLGADEGPDPETLVDPVAESRRLQREGVPAPSDPESRLPAPEEAE